MNIGNGLGQNLKKQSVEFDPNLVANGLKDSLAGGKTLLTVDEAKAVLQEVQVEMQKEQQEKMKQASEKNKADGEAFLAANKDKEGVVTLPSGLQYKIMTEGNGPKPTADDSVVCNYRGTLTDGKEFDSSYKRGRAGDLPGKRSHQGMDGSAATDASRIEVAAVCSAEPWLWRTGRGNRHWAEFDADL